MPCHSTNDSPVQMPIQLTYVRYSTRIYPMRCASTQTHSYTQIESKCYYGSHTINWLFFCTESMKKTIRIFHCGRLLVASLLYTFSPLELVRRLRFSNVKGNGLTCTISVNFFRGEWSDREKWNKLNRCKTTTLQQLKWCPKIVSVFKTR